MNELPTSPFPELHALDKQRPLPSLRELLEGAKAPSLPCPAPAGGPLRRDHDLPVLELPRFPKYPVSIAPSHESPFASQAPHESSSEGDDEDREETMQETIAALLAEDGDAFTTKPPHDHVDPSAPKPPQIPPSKESGPAEREEAAGTDEELAAALAPILKSGMGEALRDPECGLPTFLEPMLRATVRRAIAEQMDASRQFRELGAFDRLVYRLIALFTSRSYDDIVFDRTRRYQVEEVYLLRRAPHTLISYAHHDPGSHVTPRRIQARLGELTEKLRAPDGTIESTFDLPHHRLALVREGVHSLLVGVVRGQANALVRADLDYILRQVEDRFGERLANRTDAFVRILQPLLEGALLIQSPAPPH